MGCCVSTLDEKKKANSKQEDSFSKNGQFSCVSKSPPRPEEETVKEVLSETPKLKPKPIPKPELEPRFKVSTKCVDEPQPVNVEEPTKAKLIVSPNKPFLVQKVPSLEEKVPSLEQKMAIKEVKYADPSTPEEGISEVSEMCSLSESISTTTLEEQLHQQQQWGKDSASSGEVRQHKGFRSQGNNGNLRNSHNFGQYTNNSQNVQLSRNHGRSPVRRADPSPPRRGFPGPGQVGPRRDVVGENSARRSRSPAMRSNVGRSPSARRTGPSPGRVRMVHGPENGRKLEDEDSHGNGKGNENEWEGPKESLENPLVSLECFIFL